jgi:hypothetical protein
VISLAGLRVFLRALCDSAVAFIFYFLALKFRIRFGLSCGYAGPTKRIQDFEFFDVGCVTGVVVALDGIGVFFTVAPFSMAC